MTKEEINAHLGSNQILQISSAGRVEQVFALTTSETAVYEDPTGRIVSMPSTSLVVDLKQDSLLLITFCARGSARPSGTKVIPIVFINCEIDGKPCSPNINTIEYHYPQYCCDSRSFTWVVHKAGRGKHTIEIKWGMGNPTEIVISQRTLTIEAATLEINLGIKQ